MAKYPPRDGGESPKPPPEPHHAPAVSAAQKMKAAATLQTRHHGAVSENRGIVVRVEHHETDAPLGARRRHLHGNGQIGVEIHDPRRQKEQQIPGPPVVTPARHRFG